MKFAVITKVREEEQDVNVYNLLFSIFYHLVIYFSSLFSLLPIPVVNGHKFKTPYYHKENEFKGATKLMKYKHGCNT